MEELRLYFLTDGETISDPCLMTDDQLAEAEEQLGADGAGGCYWYISADEVEKQFPTFTMLSEAVRKGVENGTCINGSPL